MSGGERTPRGLRPERAREALRRELTRESSALDRLMGAGVLIGPALLSIFLPFGCWIAGGTPSDVFGIPLAMGGTLLLLFGGYVGLVNLASGGLGDRSRGALLRRCPVLDPRDPPADGTLVIAEGRLEGSPVRGPLTRREALWCVTSVNVTSSDRSRAWAYESFDDHASDLRLDVAGAKVRVEVAGARLHGGRVIDDLAPYPDGVEACLARSGLSRAEGDHVFVTERAVLRGDRVTVLGALRRPEGYREGDGLRLVGDEEDELLLHVGGREAAIRDLTPKRSPWLIPGLISFALGLVVCVALVFSRSW